MCPSTEQEIKRYTRKKFLWNPINCTGCKDCIEDCPSNALQLIEIDQAPHRHIMRYNLGRCIFCGQCALSCELGCITMTNYPMDYSTNEKDLFDILFG